MRSDISFQAGSDESKPTSSNPLHRQIVSKGHSSSENSSLDRPQTPSSPLCTSRSNIVNTAKATPTTLILFRKKFLSGGREFAASLIANKDDSYEFREYPRRKLDIAEIEWVALGEEDLKKIPFRQIDLSKPTGSFNYVLLQNEENELQTLIGPDKLTGHYFLALVPFNNSSSVPDDLKNKFLKIDKKEREKPTKPETKKLYDDLIEATLNHNAKVLIAGELVMQNGMMISFNDSSGTFHKEPDKDIPLIFQQMVRLESAQTCGFNLDKYFPSHFGSDDDYRQRKEMTEEIVTFLKIKKQYDNKKDIDNEELTFALNLIKKLSEELKNFGNEDQFKNWKGYLVKFLICLETICSEKNSDLKTKEPNKKEADQITSFTQKITLLKEQIDFVKFGSQDLEKIEQSDSELKIEAAIPILNSGVEFLMTYGLLSQNPQPLVQDNRMEAQKLEKEKHGVKRKTMNNDGS